jgi:DHA2 family metal-tetracycline-proton antiporter-like MFS transporter
VDNLNDRIVMPVWMLGLFVVVMNTTMFNVSVPSIINDLSISSDLGSWIVSSYSIGYALSTVIYSRLSDIAPIRRLVAIGLLILGLSSVLGIFAHSFALLLTARILQSAGAGAMAGLGLVLASRYIPIERRGKAISMIAAGSAMAFGLGPIVGGVISEYFGWNGLFVVTCLVLVILPILLKLLPKENPKPGKFDYFGAAWTVINATSLLLAVTQQSLIWFVASVVTIVLHVLHIRKSKGEGTFVNPEVFRQPGYNRLLVVGFCLLIINLGNLFLMPLVLANLFHKSELLIGFLIAPGAILSAMLTPFVGRWLDRYGNVRFLFIGTVILTAVVALFMTFVGRSPFVIMCGYLLFSPAFSATLASLNNQTSSILPRHLIGSGMGMMQLIQFFGGSLSVAICGLLLHKMSNTSLEHAYNHVYQLLFVCPVIAIVMLGWYYSSYRKKVQAHKLV